MSALVIGSASWRKAAASFNKATAKNLRGMGEDSGCPKTKLELALAKKAARVQNRRPGLVQDGCIERRAWRIFGVKRRLK